MSEFWPSGLEMTDSLSPREILGEADREWTDRSGGVLRLVVQETVSTSKNQILIVHARHVPTNRTIALFSIVHRPLAVYPVSIQPKDDQLPGFLRKSYYEPGIADLNLSATNILAPKGRHITNEWVCDTPSEFRSKLRQAFNQETVKSDLITLMSLARANQDLNGVAEDNESLEPISQPLFH
jgi:hypothetical protein